MSAPMLPPAPVLFSTTTGCPHASLSFCPSRRATTSVVPPAANGTTIFTGFDGNACAAASAGAKARTAAARMRVQRVMCFLLVMDIDSTAFSIRASLRREAALADHLRPARGLFADRRGELGGRVAHGRHALLR